MNSTANRSVLVLAIVVVLTVSIMLESAQAIRVHTHIVPVLAEGHSFTRKLAKDGTVEPTSDKAAVRAYKVRNTDAAQNRRSIGAESFTDAAAQRRAATGWHLTSFTGNRKLVVHNLKLK